MSRVATLGFTIGLLCLLSAKVGRLSAQGTPDRPNILLILSDDHSAPHLGSYGDPNARTPSLDRFAAEGIRFDRVYTASPQCVPSRASMMSGRSPVAVGMSRFDAPLPAEVVTLPDLLREHGYFTGAGGRIYHLDGPRIAADDYEDILSRNQLKTFANRLNYVQVDGTPRPSAVEVMEEFLEQREESPEKPFFFWYNFHEPHRRWRPESITRDPSELEIDPDIPDYPSVREDLANYYAILEEMDQKFGELMAFLDERGLSDNTIVVFMGDNGESWFRAKGTLYERGCHVPLLIRWPGHVAPGGSSDVLVSGEDLAPTLLAAAGLQPALEMTGRSFLPVVVGDDADYVPREEVFAERGAHGYNLPLTTVWFDLSRSITTQRYRLIYNALWQLRYAPVDIENYDEPVWDDLIRRHEAGTMEESFDSMYFAPERPMFELYDLEADPFEMHNLAGSPQSAELQADLTHRLAEWMTLQRDFVPLPNQPTTR